jgi:hypothetical protein
VFRFVSGEGDGDRPVMLLLGFGVLAPLPFVKPALLVSMLLPLAVLPLLPPHSRVGSAGSRPLENEFRCELRLGTAPVMPVEFLLLGPVEFLRGVAVSMIERGFRSLLSREVDSRRSRVSTIFERRVREDSFLEGGRVAARMDSRRTFCTKFDAWRCILPVGRVGLPLSPMLPLSLLPMLPLLSLRLDDPNMPVECLLLLLGLFAARTPSCKLNWLIGEGGSSAPPPPPLPLPPCPFTDTVVGLDWARLLPTIR